MDWSPNGAQSSQLDGTTPPSPTFNPAASHPHAPPPPTPDPGPGPGPDRSRHGLIAHHHSEHRQRPGLAGDRGGRRPGRPGGGTPTAEARPSSDRAGGTRSPGGAHLDQPGLAGPTPRPGGRLDPWDQRQPDHGPSPQQWRPAGGHQPGEHADLWRRWQAPQRQRGPAARSPGAPPGGRRRPGPGAGGARPLPPRPGGPHLRLGPPDQRRPATAQVLTQQPL